MNSSIEEIYQKLLDSGISKEQLKKAIHKKAKEYNGYMSKKGILFLIARELGIDIRDSETEPQFYEEVEIGIDYDEFTIPIKKVREGMINIVLLGKVIAINPQRTFSRKDGSRGLVGSFVIGDETGKIKVILWNETSAILQSSLLKDELVRVISDYSKVNKKGEIEVHISKKGKIILAPNDINYKTKLKLINIEPSAFYFENKDRPAFYLIKDLIERYKYIKRIQGKIRIEDFKEIVKKNGEKSFLLKLNLTDDSGSVIINIWGMEAVHILKIIEEGYWVRIRNLVSRLNYYTKQKELFFTKTSSFEVI